METQGDLTTIYIIRHGQSYGNAVFGTDRKTDLSNFGKLQSPLTDLGKQQAEEIAIKLQDVHFDAIFSSDLNRARETAEIIARGRSIPVKTVTTIREKNQGIFYYSKTKEERLKLEAAVAALNDQEQFTYKYSSDGESAKEAVERFVTFLKKTIPLYQGKTICVINHGAIMRAFLVYIGWARYRELPSGSIKNAGYFVLRTDGNTYTVTDVYNIAKQYYGNEE